jgi:hypothetical protein
MNDPFYRFSDHQINDLIMDIKHNNLNLNHPMLITDSSLMIESKDTDAITIELWNTIVGSRFSIDNINDLKDSAKEVLKFMDDKYPKGRGMSEKDSIIYGNAFSSSSFSGILNPKKSLNAMNSMISTLKSHAYPKHFYRPWLEEFLQPVFNHCRRYKSMTRKYSDIVLTARTSSSSIIGEGSFRDFVMTHTYDEIVNNLKNNNVPHFIYVGTRQDRRGKFRLICSFDGNIRIVDYMLNNAAYDLCENDGILSQYTTEGYNLYQMWPQLKLMANRSNGYQVVCIDYKGFDTQITMKEYLMISKGLNQYRINDSDVYDSWIGYEEWMKQPKPLLKRNDGEYNVLIPWYTTLASGLNGTHSFENLIGVALYKYALSLGYDAPNFWTNGDDQNIRIHSKHVESFMNEVSTYFDISWDKSLVGHKLAIWGKLWFSEEYHPFWEIGTFRSLWEKENSSTSHVEESKFQANYCKILQVIITLRRLKISDSKINQWIIKLCSQCNIDHTRIPLRLNNLKITQTKTNVRDVPHGLNSVKGELMNRTFKLRSLNVKNYYDMLKNMFENRQFFNLELEKVQYHKTGTMLSIRRSLRYYELVPRDVPWVYRNLYFGINYSKEDQFTRDALQGTKSYDGPCPIVYSYSDMKSLAYAIDDRNKYMWKYIQ